MADNLLYIYQNIREVKDYAMNMYSSKLILFLIVGIIISFIFFNILSFLFKTPFIIVFGLIIGYIMYKMYIN